MYVDVSRDAEDADHQIDIRRRDIESQLADHGLPEELVSEISRRIAEPSGLAGSVRRTVVAGKDGVLLDEAQAGVEDAQRVVDHGALLDLLDYLAAGDRAAASQKPQTLDRVLVAAACLSGAGVSVVNAGVVGPIGVSALLRWTETPPTSEAGHLRHRAQQAVAGS